MKVALLGKGRLAQHICEEITPAYIYKDSPESLLGLRFYGGGLSTLVNDTSEIPPCDIVISAGHEKILDNGFINRHKLVVNFHYSPLPKYRGMRPINWALKNGEKEHGVTLHRVTPGVDDGPILLRCKFNLFELDEVIDVYNRCDHYAKAIFDDFWYRGNGVFTEQPQDDGEATYYNKRDMKKLAERSGWTRD